jgi:hypothetical protein
VAVDFRENRHNDPKRDAKCKVARLLRRQLRSYKKDDPKEVQQKALPVCVLRLILSSKSTELHQAMGKLTGAAHFWAMRSCKYAKVPKTEQRQTKQICIRKIAFIRDGETLDHNSLSLHLADCVSITFERNKNKRKADAVTQWRTSDELLCPVKICASITRRILSYKGANKNSPVSLVKHKSQIINETGEMIADLCRYGVVTIRETKLGIRQSEIRTRSICSGAAMAMYLTGVPVFSIMLIGRWSSTAFIKSLRSKYKSFCKASPKKCRGSVFQTRPKPSSNKPDGEHSLQLVFVADGLNWWMKHHHQKDGGEVEPINNWSKPLISSKLYIWYRTIPCIHLVHFSVFVTWRRIPARWNPLAEDTLF